MTVGGERTRREVLAAVAARELTPDEALVLLRALEQPPAGRRASGARLLRVQVAAGTVAVVADAAVHEVVVEGPHRLRRDGDRLLLEGSDLAGGFSLVPRLGARRGAALTVRVAPTLPLEVSVDAGRLRVRGCRGGLVARVGAGSIELVDVAPGVGSGGSGVVEASADAGSVALTARPREGRWALRSALGRVSATLASDSDVRVTAAAELGRVRVPQPAAASGAHPAVEAEGHALVLGRGTALLDLRSDLGSVTVEVRDAPSELTR